MLEESLVARKELPAANAQHDHARVIAIARIADDIAVAAFHVEHDGRFLHLLEVVQRVAQLGGALEVHLVRRIRHALPDALDHLGRAPFEEEQHLVDHHPVRDHRLQANTGRLAPPDVVVEARPLGRVVGRS